MRILGSAVGALLMALALAGCSDGGDADGEGDGGSDTGVPITYGNTSSSASRSSSGPPTSSSSSSSSGAPGGNRPPTASVSASVTGSNATFKLAGSDPDGDALAWELDFGDGNATSGTALPATVNHTYALGNFTANLTVTDGKAPVSYEVMVEAGTAGGAGGQAFAGSWTVGGIGCTSPDQPYAPELDGVDVAVFDVDPATIGLSFVATFTGSALFNGLAFYDGATPAANVGSFSDIDTPGTIVGEVPAGAVHGMAFSCLGGASVAYTAG